MTARPILLIIAVAAATLAAPALPAQQRVQAGRGTVSTVVRVGLVIPPRLRLRADDAPRLQRQRGDTATYAMDLEVAANLAWTLGVVGADAAADGPVVRVRDHAGAWRTLCAAEGLVTLVPAGAPSNGAPVRLELQVIGRARSAPGLTFDLQPASR